MVRKIRQSSEYKKWRNAVLKRAGNKCERCGSSEKIRAHHKISIYEDITLALEVENGEALCEMCHKKEHKERGRV